MSTMRPGIETGSGINHLYSRMTKGAPEPEIGMAATVLLWSDRHAATVTAIEDTKSGLIVEVQEDLATVVSGNSFDGSAEYVYQRNRNGARHTFRRDKNGSWDQVRKNPTTGRWNKVSQGGVIIGKREEYRDPHF